jgi:hypothetical protein
MRPAWLSSHDRVLRNITHSDSIPLRERSLLRWQYIGMKREVVLLETCYCLLNHDIYHSMPPSDLRKRWKGPTETQTVQGANVEDCDDKKQISEARHVASLKL